MFDYMPPELAFTTCLRNLPPQHASGTYTSQQRNSPEPSTTHTSTHRNPPEPSGFRNLPLEPTPAHTVTLRNLPELASGTYTSTHRNSPEPSGTFLGTCSCDPHRHTPELIWAEDPSSLRCWGKKWERKTTIQEGMVSKQPQHLWGNSAACDVRPWWPVSRVWPSMISMNIFEDGIIWRIIWYLKIPIPRSISGVAGTFYRPWRSWNNSGSHGRSWHLEVGRLVTEGYREKII